MTAKLFYFHDPMCSWCWGFAPTWERLQQLCHKHFSEDLEVDFILGGLAPDSDQPMPLSLQQTLQSYWHRIEKLLGTEFNHDFWTLCQPRRSTYPACRAVIAASNQGAGQLMISAIQEAYYLKAMNPSDIDTLIQLAEKLVLNTKQFKEDLCSDETESELMKQIALYKQLSSRGFPSLALLINDLLYEIPVDYKHPQAMFDMIDAYLKNHK
ncbi:DsbA family protein [Kangiella marina]|uniref:DsbA family protein n=1 Tax=Kangiella marina TaxID=1079178 RepID=A0ABP8IA62_9GAMM